MKKISKIVLIGLVSLLGLSCSMDYKLKNTTWTCTTDYYVEEDSKSYTAEVKLTLDENLSGTFSITHERATSTYQNILLNIEGTTETVEDEEGINWDWLIVTDGETVLEFKIEDCSNPTQHYELEWDDPVYGDLILLQE